MTKRTPAIVIDTSSAEQTAAVGEAVGRCCEAGDIVGLQGELGAGKTQFVRGLAKGMGLSPRQVSSPTFVMAQEYEPEAYGDGPHCLLVHIDAYRINSDEDLASIGWHGHGEELREGAVVAVEWASLIQPALGDDLLWVELRHESKGRRISLSAQGAWSGKMQVVKASLLQADLNIVEGAEP
ncbi:MAG: tRNA (adenosine(37)-N6)-threonylcarbamoyltransferase complex ATPase subunit type 1 TsaE [Phycisphaeraceae bacterium]